MDIGEIGLEDLANLTLEDDLSLNLIPELLTSLILGSLFPGLSSLLLSELVLLLGLDSVGFSFLDGFVLGLNAS
jgi:hypothetical protein